MCIREKTLVKRALVELVHGVDVPHGGKITKDDLVWADSYDGTVFLKKFVDDLALLKTKDVCRDP